MPTRRSGPLHAGARRTDMRRPDDRGSTAPTLVGSVPTGARRAIAGDERRARMGLMPAPEEWVTGCHSLAHDDRVSCRAHYRNCALDLRSRSGTSQPKLSGLRLRHELLRIDGLSGAGYLLAISGWSQDGHAEPTSTSPLQLLPEGVVVRTASINSQAVSSDCGHHEHSCQCLCSEAPMNGCTGLPDRL